MLENPQSSDSGSLEKSQAVMAQDIDVIKQKIHALEQERLLKELCLPEEELARLGLPAPPPKRTRRGRGFRPIMAHEITETKNKLKQLYPEINETMVAKAMNLNYFTYKKYAKMHKLWNPNPNLKSKHRHHDTERGKYKLSEILAGKWPDCPVYQIKRRLLWSGTKKEQCELCGHTEGRWSDGKVPLKLNFVDGNPKNHKLDNMKLYCYNCSFVTGQFYVRGGSQYFDPDWLQGADKEDL